MGTDTVTNKEGKIVANPLALRFASSSRKSRIAGKVQAAAIAEDQRLRRLRAIQAPELSRIGESTTGRSQLIPDMNQGRKTLLGQ